MSKTPQNKARRPIDKADRPEQDKTKRPEPTLPNPGRSGERVHPKPSDK